MGRQRRGRGRLGAVPPIPQERRRRDPNRAHATQECRGDGPRRDLEGCRCHCTRSRRREQSPLSRSPRLASPRLRPLLRRRQGRQTGRFAAALWRGSKGSTIQLFGTRRATSSRAPPGGLRNPSWRPLPSPSQVREHPARWRPTLPVWTSPCPAAPSPRAGLDVLPRRHDCPGEGCGVLGRGRETFVASPSGPKVVCQATLARWPRASSGSLSESRSNPDGAAAFDGRRRSRHDRPADAAVTWSRSHADGGEVVRPSWRRQPHGAVDSGGLFG